MANLNYGTGINANHISRDITSYYTIVNIPKLTTSKTFIVLSSANVLQNSPLSLATRSTMTPERKFNRFTVYS